MNKKIALISVLAGVALASAAGVPTATTATESFHWLGTSDGERVITGVGAVGSEDEDNSGYWYYYDDSNDGGDSKFTWAAELGNAYAANSFEPVITAAGGISGTATIGTAYKYAYLGVGFNLVNGDQSGADVNVWNGICVTYTSSAAFKLELGEYGEGDKTAATYDAYNSYVSALAASSTAKTVDLAWSKFAQASGWGTTVAWTTYVQSIYAIKFKFEKSSSFNILEVGSAGTCGAAPIAIKSAKAVSSVKAQLSGRTLNLSGFTSAASVEVINLQGQIVVKAVVNGSAALNLAKLDRGVYMVRVAGKAFNMNQKIVLN